MEKTKQREKPCAHMLRRGGDACGHRCAECSLPTCVFDDNPTCALLSAVDRIVPCPFADDDGNANREYCKLCPLPEYHESDPVTKFLDFGFREHLDNLRDVAGCCLDGNCFTEKAEAQGYEDCITHTLQRMSMCPTVPSRLRIMYLGAEWRRRNT